jgi:hypothetical protein
MSKNYDIQTVSKLPVTEVAVNVGGVVPAGMTRYVTFVRIGQSGGVLAGGSAIYLCSGTASVGTTNALASAAQKLVVTPTSAAPAMSVPATPDTEHPLFTVAAGKYLNALLSSTNALDEAAHLFVQFFDE